MIKKYKRKTAQRRICSLHISVLIQLLVSRSGQQDVALKLREAKIAEAKLQTEIQSKGFLNNDITTFKQVYELWIEQYKCTVRESTFVRVSNMFKIKILKEFDNMPIQSITTPYCQKL